MREFCKICKKKIYKPSRNKKYCSSNCQLTVFRYQKLQWNKRNFSKISEYKRTYYLKTKSKWQKYNKEHKKELRKSLEYKQKQADYIKKYRKDIKHKIIDYLRTRIWYALKGTSKSKSTMKLVGCSIEQLRQYLQNKFKQGMTWDNYGKWHIDHIKPCISFDLIKVSEQCKCFNYKNLQPLWAEENCSKGGQYGRI